MLNAVIIFMVCISCIPYYFKYEKKKPQTRESVVLAVMIALTVASRMLFAFSPGFKPVSAMVINDFWDSFRNFIFFCDGYLDTSGSRRWISVDAVCGSIRNFGSSDD